MKLEKTIQAYVRRHKLIAPGQRIVVGVSGGADSVALLHLLAEEQPELGIKILVAHVNHHLRKSADRDQRFVERLCARHRWPCHILHLKWGKRSTASSLEERARTKRLQALIRLAVQKHAAAIALAHHQDDLAETVLMRILRGTGLKGLPSMLPKRTMNGMTVIRPLLETPKIHIDTYIRTNKLAFRVDPSNRQRRFLRNRIRRDLLPLLENYNPNIRWALANLGRQAAADYDLLQQAGQGQLERLARFPKDPKSLSIDMNGLLRLPLGLQRMVLRLALENVQGDTRRLTFKHILEIEDLLRNRPIGSIVNLPKGLCLKKGNKHLLISL